jgi:hypothetical protein
MRAGVSGACDMLTPRSASASSTAEITAAATGIVPPSPTPFTPSGLSGEGLSWKRSYILGVSVAAGSRYSAKVAVTGWPSASKPICS